MRIIYIILGFITLGLGILGIILPILPTVPFFLCTTFFFSKGSKRFEVWFKSTNLYKKHLEGFVKTKAMTLKKKLILLSSVSLILVVTMWMVNSVIASAFIILVIVAKYLFFIFYVKTVSKEEYEMMESAYECS